MCQKQILSAPTCKTLSRAQNSTISLSEAWPCPQSRCGPGDSEGPIGSMDIFVPHRTGVGASVYALERACACRRRAGRLGDVRKARLFAPDDAQRDILVGASCGERWHWTKVRLRRDNSDFRQIGADPG